VNGFDRFAVDLVDHYKIGTGDMEGDPRITTADGFIGPKRVTNPVEGGIFEGAFTGAVEKQQKAEPSNYYFLNVNASQFTETDAPPDYDPGAGIMKITNGPQKGKSVTQSPPADKKWIQILRGRDQQK
jgi:hypothetical protein